MLLPMLDAAPEPLWVACLCAAWCRLCDSYGPLFDEAMAPLRTQHPGLQTRWIDIEDEADLVGDFDVETFPTLVVMDTQAVRFAGPVTPQPETLQRVLRAASQPGHVAPVQPPEVEAFAQRLRAQSAAGSTTSSA